MPGASMKENGCSSGDLPHQLLSETLIRDLVKLRKKRKIGQEQVAHALGITQGGLSQIESLKIIPSLGSIILYAQAIGVEIGIDEEYGAIKKRHSS